METNIVYKIENQAVMRLIIDSREQAPYDFATYDVDTEPGTLHTGDYSLAGFEDRVAIERKSLDDLIACLCVGRERFERAGSA